MGMAPAAIPVLTKEREDDSSLPRGTRRHRYVKVEPAIHFPSEERLEDAVSETKRHLKARTTLFLLLESVLTGCAVGSDQFVYYNAADPRESLSPDVFVKRGTSENDFDTWKVWERGAPELAVEIVSDSDRSERSWSEKLARYHVSGVSEIVRFDPENEVDPVRVWDRVDGVLLERGPESTPFRECATLGMWWVVVPTDFGPQLRLAKDRDGRSLVETPIESNTRLMVELQEARRARSEAEHARALAEHDAAREAAAKQAAEKKAAEEVSAKQALARERDAALEEIARLRAELAKRSG
ncbi:MAG: Uma2 family endonuclease [Polyangiaceae bacterium]|nr:Uma2 family endonuclease [Polyangiaceae bacterium]